MSRPTSRPLLMLAGFGLATAGAAWYSSRHSKGSRTQWYRHLDKPTFTPPDALFPAVWAALYVLIAWSGWRVWCAAPSRHRTQALRLWISQLTANANWPKLFFDKHRLDLALADSLALEGAIFSYINAARKVDPAAAGAFVPYAAWVAFTTALNAEIIRRNLFLHSGR